MLGFVGHVIGGDLQHHRITDLKRRPPCAGEIGAKAFVRRRQADGDEDSLGVMLVDRAARRQFRGRNFSRMRRRRAAPVHHALDGAKPLPRAADDSDAGFSEIAHLPRMHDAGAHAHQEMRLLALLRGLDEDARIIEFASRAAERLVVHGIAAAKHDDVGRGVLVQRAQTRSACCAWRRHCPTRRADCRRR